MSLTTGDYDRPICTPQLPGSHTGALDFFIAGEAYNLIAADHGSWGVGMGSRDEKTRLAAVGSPDRRKMPHVVKADARTVAWCRPPTFNILCNRLRGSDQWFEARLGVSSAR